jgi:hypothetical protein
VASRFAQVFVHRVNGYAQLPRCQFGIEPVQNEAQYLLLSGRKLPNVADTHHPVTYLRTAECPQWVEKGTLAGQFGKSSKLNLHILYAVAAPFSCVGDLLFQLPGAARAVDVQMKALHLFDDKTAQSRVSRVQRVKLSELA